jgi:hypothetical protein
LLPCAPRTGGGDSVGRSRNARASSIIADASWGGSGSWRAGAREQRAASSLAVAVGLAGELSDTHAARAGPSSSAAAAGHSSFLPVRSNEAIFFLPLRHMPTAPSPPLAPRPPTPFNSCFRPPYPARTRLLFSYASLPIFHSLPLTPTPALALRNFSTCQRPGAPAGARPARLLESAQRKDPDGLSTRASRFRSSAVPSSLFTPPRPLGGVCPKLLYGSKGPFQKLS